MTEHDVSVRRRRKSWSRAGRRLEPGVPFAILGTDGSGSLAVGLAHTSPNLAGWDILGVAGLGTAVLHGLNPAIAGRAIDLLRQGLEPRAVLDRLTLGPAGAWQALILDAEGQAAACSGNACEAAYGHTIGTDHVAAGLALQSANVVGAMSLSFERSMGDSLGARLLFALESGERAGSDRRGQRSATIKVFAIDQSAALDLRVDSASDPIASIGRLLTSSGTGGRPLL